MTVVTFSCGYDLLYMYINISEDTEPNTETVQMHGTLLGGSAAKDPLTHKMICALLTTTVAQRKLRD